MNRTELIEATAQASGLTKVQAGAAIGNALDIIQNSLAAGDSVALVGFGTFKVTKRAARVGRNPRTGAATNIGAKLAAKFTPGQKLKDALN